MNRRERDGWTAASSLVFVAVISLVVAGAVIVLPAILGAVRAAGRLQAGLVDRAIAGVAALTGWQFDGEAVVVRLVAATGLHAAVAAGLYFLFLVGSNIGTLLLLAAGSAILGAFLTLVGSLQTTASADHLSSLRFWE